MATEIAADSTFPFAENYHPKNSKTKRDELVRFLALPFSENLDDIPGIGKRIVQFLAEPSDLFEFKPIYNSSQLFGRFLMMKKPGVSPIQHCEQFYQWLLEKGVRHNTTEIVQAVAEKVATWMPMIYDEGAYDIIPVSQTGWSEQPISHNHYGCKSVPVHGDLKADNWTELSKRHIHTDAKEVPIRRDEDWVEEPHGDTHMGEKRIHIHDERVL